MAAVHQRAGNRHALLLAAGQLVRAVAGALGQAQAVSRAWARAWRSAALMPA
jgi:hypothetical protein